VVKFLLSMANVLQPRLSSDPFDDDAPSEHNNQGLKNSVSTPDTRILQLEDELSKLRAELAKLAGDLSRPKELAEEAIPAPPPPPPSDFLLTSPIKIKRKPMSEDATPKRGQSLANLDTSAPQTPISISEIVAQGTTLKKTNVKRSDMFLPFSFFPLFSDDAQVSSHACLT
jgi:hypothetical protein